MFIQELQYWNIDPEDVSSCCIDNIYIDKRTPPEEPRSPSVQRAISSFNGDNLDARVEGGVEEIEEDEDETIDNSTYEQFKGVFLSRVRLALWRLFEDPHSSNAAKIFSVLSIAFVLTSVFCLIIASLQSLQEYNPRSGQYEPLFFLKCIEYGCIAWFTMDFVIRFIIVVDRCSFLKETMNIVDILSIIPFYTEFLMSIVELQTSNIDNIKGALLIMRILRVLRVMRLFRLARYSGGLKSIGQTVAASKKEISMLAMFISTTIILFSTMVYFFEKDVENTKFTSIPATFWWCIATMTTVGYGDLVPKTLLGKLVASVTSVSGVIVLAFPITMIVENFNKCYRKEGTSATNITPENPGQRIHRFGFL